MLQAVKGLPTIQCQTIQPVGPAANDGLVPRLDPRAATIRLVSTRPGRIKPVLRAQGYRVTETCWNGCSPWLEKGDEDLLLVDLTDCLDGPRPWDPAEVVRRCLQAPVPALFLVNSLDKPSIQAVQTLAPFNYLLDPLKTTELRVTVKLTLLFRTVEKARQQVSTDCQFIPIPGSTTALTAGPTAESTAGLAVVNSTGRTA